MSEHIYKQFDAEMEEIRSGVMAMGGLVETQFARAIHALKHTEVDLIDAVGVDERAINQMQVEIDQQCSQIIAKRQPTAIDLRMARTENIPANASVAKKGVDYKISPQARASLNVFVAEVPKLSPVAYQIQGYKLNRAIFNPTAARLGQAIAGEMSLDDALKRISADIDEQTKAAAK